MPAVLGIFAHPDDIEFVAAGTMLLLEAEGGDLNYFVLSSGNLGSMTIPADELRRIRGHESLNAATLLGAPEQQKKIFFK